MTAMEYWDGTQWVTMPSRVVDWASGTGNVKGDVVLDGGKVWLALKDIPVGTTAAPAAGTDWQEVGGVKVSADAGNIVQVSSSDGGLFATAATGSVPVIDWTDTQIAGRGDRDWKPGELARDPNNNSVYLCIKDTHANDRFNKLSSSNHFVPVGGGGGGGKPAVDDFASGTVYPKGSLVRDLATGQVFLRLGGSDGGHPGLPSGFTHADTNWATLSVRKFTTNALVTVPGSGTTGVVVTHNLNTDRVTVSVYDVNMRSLPIGAPGGVHVAPSLNEVTLSAIPVGGAPATPITLPAPASAFETFTVRETPKPWSFAGSSVTELHNLTANAAGTALLDRLTREGKVVPDPAATWADRIMNSGYGVTINGALTVFWWDGANWHLGGVPAPLPDFSVHAVIVG